MTTFLERVYAYPLVNDSCECISKLYNASKSYEKVGYVCELAETVGSSAFSTVKGITQNSSLVTKIDSLACDYLLCPLENKVTQVHYPSEKLLGPLADYVLGKAEYMADFVLPPYAVSKPVDRQLRVIQLKNRIQHKLSTDCAKILEAIKHILNVLKSQMKNVDLSLLRNKIESLYQLLNNKFHAAISYLNGPAIEQNFARLREQISKLLEDLASGRFINSMNLEAIQSIIGQLQSQVLAVHWNTKKVRSCSQDEIAEVKILPIHKSETLTFNNVHPFVVQEEDLASENSGSDTGSSTSGASFESSKDHQDFELTKRSAGVHQNHFVTHGPIRF